MHRCLYISEVLQVIADSFGTGYDGTLLQMALTCRVFFDPAMNALWRTLTDPALVYLVLPEHLRTISPEGEVRITGSPSEEEWQRVQDYARRVHTAQRGVRTIYGKAPYSICSTSISSYCPEGHLFPNLRSFTARNRTQYDGSAALIHSMLRHLEYVFPATSSCVAPLICALSRCAQTLQVLEIRLLESWGSTEERFAEDLVNAVAELPVITSLSLGSLSLSALKNFVSASTLRDLKFTLGNVDPAETGSLTFPSLRHLTLKYRSPQHTLLPPFFKRLVAPMLEEVILDDYCAWRLGGALASPAGPIALCLGSLLLSMSHLRTLQSLIYDATWVLSRPPEHEDTLTLETLAPLLAMPHLAALDMRALPFAFAPADVLPLAQAWPQMQNLRLGDAMLDSPAAALAVEDLLPFAKRCPQLHTLGLPVCITSAPARGHVQTAAGVRSLPVDLYVLKVDADFRRDAALFLAEVFPAAHVMGDGPLEALEELNRLISVIARGQSW